MEFEKQNEAWMFPCKIEAPSVYVEWYVCETAKKALEACRNDRQLDLVVANLMGQQNKSVIWILTFA